LKTGLRFPVWGFSRSGIRIWTCALFAATATATWSGTKESAGDGFHDRGCGYDCGFGYGCKKKRSLNYENCF
jgi:hypothetical protein